MRISTISALALPLLAAATQQESPLDQVKAQAQYYFDKISSYIPNPNKLHTTVAAHEAAAKAGGKTLHVLTLDNWEETIRGSVKPVGSTPEEWWLLISGGNKTCYGHCGQVETAFNETALLFSVKPNAPHFAYLNCDIQPVLCNSWAAGPPNLWIINVSAKPAPVEVRLLHLNSTTTTVKTLTDLHSSQKYKKAVPYEGYFHPFDGALAKYGLAVPLGYVLWVMAVIPSWAFMIFVSFMSRNIMGRRTLGPQPGGPAGGPTRAAPAGR